MRGALRGRGVAGLVAAALLAGVAGPSAAQGGARTFGNVVVGWRASADSALVVVQVTMGGAAVAYGVLSPANPVLTVDGVVDIDSIKGSIGASFGPGGTTGQLDGGFQWWTAGQAHRYRGFIGAWPPPEMQGPHTAGGGGSPTASTTRASPTTTRGARTEPGSCWRVAAAGPAPRASPLLPAAANGAW
jgi:hypothetical protein